MSRETRCHSLVGKDQPRAYELDLPIDFRVTVAWIERNPHFSGGKHCKDSDQVIDAVGRADSDHASGNWIESGDRGGTDQNTPREFSKTHRAVGANDGGALRKPARCTP